MGYRLNRLDEPVFMAVSKPMQTEFGIHHRLECCVGISVLMYFGWAGLTFDFSSHFFLKFQVP